MTVYLVAYDLGEAGSPQPDFSSVHTRNGSTNKSRAHRGYPVIGHVVAVEAQNEGEAAETVRLIYQGASQNYLVAPLSEVREIEVA